MNIAVIGTGKMGNPMAANLMKAGHRLTVNDVDRGAAANLLEAGARWADTPAEGARDSEITFT
ncbi:MAG TPA: NAD(P)-binding domain-containing protein, partial [Dehalococcoidia bacterium]|nr:NAD(P)-binding domain-containing protein [Dehalococcoidia bacterium]